VRPGDRERQHDRQRQEAPPATEAAGPLDDRVAMASALGNQTYGAFAAAALEAPAPRGRAVAGPADAATSALLARAVLARQDGSGSGGAATASPPQGAAQGAASWVAPMDLGTATDKAQARLVLGRMREEAMKVKNAEFAELDPIIEEIEMRLRGMEPSGDLSAFDAQQLTWLGTEFKEKYDAAVRVVAQALVRQLTAWLGDAPIDDKVVFELREHVHKQFVNSEDSDVLAKSAELLDKAEDFVGRFKKITGYAVKAKDYVEAAKKFEDLDKGLKEIKDKLGEIKEYLELARNIGKMTGTLGTTPGGVDAVGAFDATLDVMNFVITKSGVPGITQLWEGYIYKASKLAVKLLRGLYDTMYTKDRESVQGFFSRHRGDAVAPSIDKLLRGEESLLMVHLGEPEKHFPGGQPMLDFMWKLMRDEATSVPGAVEKYFLKWREEMGAGVDKDDQIKSDSAWYNAYNLFTTEHSPNLLAWLKRHKEEAWTKLYGGMPPPV
jgi:hypothetical protein